LIDEAARATCSSATFKLVKNGFNNPDASFSVFPSLETSNSHLPDERKKNKETRLRTLCFGVYTTKTLLQTLIKKQRSTSQKPENPKEKVARTLNALETIGITHNQEAYQTSFSYIEGDATLYHSSDHFTQANAISTIVSIWHQP